MCAREQAKNESNYESKTNFINTRLCSPGERHGKTVHRKANSDNDNYDNIPESAGLGGSKK